MMSLARKFKYALWVLNGYLGRRITLGIPQTVTVLITYYNPSRMQQMEAQIRNLLRCDFVNKIVISNHNPDVHIEEKVKVRDARLLFLNQPVHRGCGYRWVIAQTLQPEYLVVIDDDVWLFPTQLAQLFRHLVAEPEIPHGFTGMLHQENDEFEYHERKNMSVDYLCEVYAVTRHHLNRYQELAHCLTYDKSIANIVAASHDFMVISQTGDHNPKIHQTERLYRSPTYNQPGVAVHKENGFQQNMPEVYQALRQITTSNKCPA